MSNDFQNKLAALTPELQAMLLSDYNRIVSLKIQQKFKLNFGAVDMMDTWVSQIYFGELKPTDLSLKVKDALKLPDNVAKKIAVDILGTRILPAIDVASVINGLGASAESYKKYLETFKKVVAEEKNGTYNREDYLFDDEVKPKATIQETDEEIVLPEDLNAEAMKMHLEKFFEESLDDLLSMENSPVLTEINENLATSLSVNDHLAKELAQILEKNQSKIGDANIILEDKELPPTVSNWLKDFFGVAGTQDFDTLSIAKYIISSENAKKLNELDQAKLRRFLGLYYNINFFPAPFNALPVTEWEIIPGVNVPAETKTEPAPAPIVTERPGPKKLERQPKWSVAKPVAPTAPVSQIENPDLIELKKMLEQYPAGSLERAAIEEEIKLLEHK